MKCSEIVINRVDFAYWIVLLDGLMIGWCLVFICLNELYNIQSLGISEIVIPPSF